MTVGLLALGSTAVAMYALPATDSDTSKNVTAEAEPEEKIDGETSPKRPAKTGYLTKIYTEPNGSFSLTVPADWRVTESDNGVVFQSGPGTLSVTLTDRHFLAHLKERLPLDGVEVESGAIKSGGRTVSWISYVDSDSTMELVPIKIYETPIYSLTANMGTPPGSSLPPTFNFDVFLVASATLEAGSSAEDASRWEQLVEAAVGSAVAHPEALEPDASDKTLPPLIPMTQ